VAFYSRQLRGAERRYSATEMEALAVVASVNHFLPYLATVVTDHKAMESMMSSKTLNRQVQGWALKLQTFDFVIQYRAGELNANADGLSRQAWEMSQLSDTLCVESETVGAEEMDTDPAGTMKSIPSAVAEDGSESVQEDVGFPEEEPYNNGESSLGQGQRDRTYNL